MKKKAIQSSSFRVHKDSETDQSDDDSVLIRPVTTGGRIRIWDKKDRAASTESSFLELGHSCICHEKIKRYKRTLIEREKVLSKALKLIRKDQRMILFEGGNKSQERETPLKSSKILEFLPQKNLNLDKLHLAVLYASPLGYEVPDGMGSKAFKVIQELDFHNDINHITTAIEGGNNQVNYSIQMGTPMNFISSISKSPYVLHFIGHGISNHETYGKKEDCLVLENKDGSGQLVSSRKLEMILDVCNFKLDVVFLSSCYSENQADVFLNAGAKHVVCIQRNKKVMDEACIKFSSAFYQALFSELRTPCEAYNIAQQTLSISQGLEGQSALFIMKTTNSINEPHSCHNFILYKGVTNRIDKLSKGICFMKNLPTKPAPFVGRNQDVRRVLQILKEGKRLITITGEPGIGKTTVAHAVIHYLKERNEELIKNGVVFLSGNNCASLPTWLHTFNTKIIEANEKVSVKLQNKKDTLQVFKEIMKKIKDLDMLLIIDNAESFLISINVLKEFLEMIFERSQHIKVLLTSKIEPISYLGGINGVHDSVIRLKPLTPQFSERLLCEKADKMIAKDERLQLQKREPERIHAGFKNGYQHLFGYLLGGHPITISLAANIYSTNDLNHLYETLVKSTILNSLTQGTAGDLVVKNLTLSLNLSLKLYNDKKIYDFFNLMGYLPGGARKEDIDALWQKVSGNSLNEWHSFCIYLEKASIIMRKKIKQNKNEIEIFQLVPMIKNIAEETSEEKDKKIHKIVTKYYIQILEAILKENSVRESSEDNQSIMNNLWFFEMNIWECVYRALEIKKNIDFSEIDRNNSMASIDKASNFSPEKEKHSKFEPIQKKKFDNTLDKELIIGQNKEQSSELRNVMLNLSGNKGSDNSDLESSKEDNDALEDFKPKSKPFRKITEHNFLSLMMKNKERSIKEEEDELVLNDVIEMVKPQIMPRTTSNDLQDSNVLSFIEKSVMPNKTDKKLIKPKPKIVKKKVEAGLGDNSSFLLREMDKKLKRTINSKVANIIKSNKKLSSLSMPKDELFSKLSHKLMEMQEQHKLYKGNAVNEISKKGKTVKKINDDVKIMILYLTNLILFSKKTDVVKVIEEYGKYFYDKNLCEANLRKLKGLALIRNKKDNSFETSTEAIKEFLHAKVIFQKHDCYHGVGICCAGVGFVLYEIFTHYVKNKSALLDYAKRTFIESLNNYTIIAHDYGMSYCYDMLQDIKRELGQNFSEEYRRYMTLQNKIRNDIDHKKNTFIERVQGVEMSLLIENVMEVTSSATLEEHRNDDIDEMVSIKYIMDRRKMVESVNQANEQEYNNHMSNFIAIVSDPGRGDSQVFIPLVNKKIQDRTRGSLEVQDKGSIQSSLNKLKLGMKVRDKFKSKIKGQNNGEVSPSKESGPYFKSLTNVKSKVRVNFNDSTKKLKPKRTKTFGSDDLSEDSSDLEFCENQRFYSRLQKISEPAMNTIKEKFLGKVKKSKKREESNPLEIEEESTIQYSVFKKKKRREVGFLRKSNPSSLGRKGKLQMRNIVDKLQLSTKKHLPKIANKMREQMSPNLPSISIVPLKNMMTEKDFAEVAFRAAASKNSDYMSIQ
ncbi:unnamed protein product [Moneuplotes crassus]|uniref:AAA+ ATPase domain-containing protein n=1 Tax=Euplotes crassus TaxID=5936 RepID=A0AAD1Y7C9_EUPCR|nr:unnamed protein product [Moneuplotes crassus]